MWFQNRRTKQKKDQGKDSELRSVVSETAATCSVLRLLEQGRLLSPPGLPGLLPPCASGALGSALRGPGLAAGSGTAAAAAAAAARQVRGAVCGGGLGAAVGKGRAGGRRGRGSGGRPAGGLLRTRSGPAALGKAASLWGLCPGSASARPSLGTCRGLV